MAKKVLILGSGVSGLIVGSLLSEVAEVTVIEQSEHVGGRVQSVNVQGYQFDVGATLITPYFIDFLSTKVGVKLDMVDITWDIVATKERIPMRIDFSLTALEDLHKITGRPWTSFLWPMLMFFTHIHDLKTMSIKEFLEEIDLDKKLQVFLTAGSVDAGLPTDMASAYTLKLLEYAHNFKYPVGGTSQIPQRLAEKFKSNGGTIRTSTNVAGIKEKRGSVEVYVESGHGSETIEADYVVSCMGVPHTLNVLKFKTKQIKNARKLLARSRPTIQTTHLLYAYEGNAKANYKGRAPLLNYYPLDTIDEINGIMKGALNGVNQFKGFYVHFPALVDETQVIDGKYPLSFWSVTTQNPSEEDIVKFRQFAEEEYTRYLPDFKERAQFLGYQSPRSFIALYNDPGTTSNVAGTVDFPVFPSQLSKRVYMAGSAVEVEFASSVIQASMSAYKVAMHLKKML